MSLINDMLKDLQEQKGDGAKQKTQLKPKMMDRIPYLPLPLVLAGGGVLLLVFVWWMAGVLSEAMFVDETSKPEVQQAQVAQDSAQEVARSSDQELAKSVITEPAEEESLTEEERMAEPPVVAEPVEKIKPSAVVASVAVPEKPAVQPVIREKQVVVKKAPVKAPVAQKIKPPVAKPVARKAAVKSAPTKAPAPAVASTPKRLHPDQLPGAVRTPVRQAPLVPPLDPRPTRIPANTPYGMADEAYLDGQWALSHQRSNLAVQSLQHALELYPGHLQARELLVDLMSQKGKSGEAMYLLAEGLEIAPDYMPFKKSYVKLLSEQDDFEAAIEVMMQGGMPTVDEDPEAHVLLATLYQRLGEPFLTAQTYRNLLVAWPQTGAFWVGLGSALEKQKLPAEAVKCYQRALETKSLRADLSDFARKRLRLLKQS